MSYVIVSNINEVLLRHPFNLDQVSILHLSDFFEFKSIQQCGVNLVCQTQIINGVDRPDPTDHKYVKLKRFKFNEKKTYSETLKPQPRLKCYLYHNFFFSLSILLSRFKQSKLYFPMY